MGYCRSAVRSSFHSLQTKARARRARSTRPGERQNACSPGVLLRGCASHATERLHGGSAFHSSALEPGSIGLRGRRLCASHEGQSRGMPRYLLSALPCQSDRVEHPPLLIGRGGLASRTISSPRHGQGTEEMESSKMTKSKSRKMTKTNIAPSYLARQMSCGCTRTLGDTPPRFFGKWRG
jgi:hypothetical protein